jgi:hypothetical protein
MTFIGLKLIARLTTETRYCSGIMLLTYVLPSPATEWSVEHRASHILV